MIKKIIWFQFCINGHCADDPGIYDIIETP